MANKVLKYNIKVTHQIASHTWRGVYRKELPLATFNIAHISVFPLISSTGGKELNTKGSEVLSFDFEFTQLSAA